MKQKPAKEKVALYCRVSSTKQKEEFTIQRQKELLPAYAESRDWKIHDTYVDEGISGSTIDKRPEFKKLLEDMEAGKFQILLAIDPDRLARPEFLMDTALIIDKARKANIRFAFFTGEEYDPKTFMGRFMMILKFEMGAEERRKIGRNSVQGKLIKVLNGEWSFRQSPFGYRWDKEEKMFVQTEDIETYHKMVELRLEEDRSLAKITGYLRTHGYKSARSKDKFKSNSEPRWQACVVSGILKSHIYTGEHLYDASNLWEKVHGNKDNIPNDRIIQFKSIPAITKGKWNQLQESFENFKWRSGPKRKTDHSLFRQYLYCKFCGGRIVNAYKPNKNKTSKLTDGYYQYYHCSNRCNPDSGDGLPYCGELPWMKADIVDENLWKLTITALTKPGKMLAEWQKLNIDGKNIEELENKINELDEKIIRQTNKKNKILKMYLDEVYSEKELNEEASLINRSINELEVEKKDLTDRINLMRNKQNTFKLIHDNYNAIEKEYSELFGDPKMQIKLNKLSFDLKRKILDLIFSKKRIGLYSRTKEDILREVEEQPYIPDDAPLQEIRYRAVNRTSKSFERISLMNDMEKDVYADIEMQIDPENLINAIKLMDEKVIESILLKPMYHRITLNSAREDHRITL